MRLNICLVFVLLPLGLGGCFPKLPQLSNLNHAQSLPVSAKAIVPNGAEIQLEVARTPQEQALGLMYRPALPDNRGMLFVFPSPQPVSFWMKDVPVPLDMVFLNHGVVEYIQAFAPPCPAQVGQPCPNYGPGTPIDQVIELRGGRAQELGLQLGDKVQVID